MGQVVLVQHVQSGHHVNEMSGGWTDTPLTDFGRRQEQRIKDILDGHEYTLVSSDLLRACQTAEIIGDRLGLPVTQNAGLREINPGEATGRTKDWVRTHRSPRTDSAYDIDHREFPTAQTWRQFHRRVRACMEALGASNESKNLLVVTHGEPSPRSPRGG